MNKMHKKSFWDTGEINGLLLLYRFWGLATMASFAMFLLLMAMVIASSGLSYAMLAAALFAGFLWIGTTSISRHSLVLLKNSIGKKVGLLEFVSTQFAFVLFPYMLRRVKKEVETYGRAGGQK